jgi:hypothetical protein
MLRKILKILGFALLLLFSIIFIVTAYNIVKIKTDPYKYVSEAEDDVAVNDNLNLSNKVLSKKEMDSLLIRIFSTSIRLDCFDVAFHFVEDHQLYYLKPVIENRLDYFYTTFPNDTTLIAVIRKGKHNTLAEDQRMTKEFVELYRDAMNNWN